MLNIPIKDQFRESRVFNSRLTVLGALGGPDETRIEGTAAGWNAPCPAFHTLAVEVAGAGRLLPRVPGLPDDAFVHDGTMTKREMRALTLAKLMPARGARLWDIGCGCGSVSVEWMRAAPDAEAIGIDSRADRLALARENAVQLGVPRLALVEARVPDAMGGLARPDAVFIGGGLSAAVIARALESLEPGGRLVANAVTLESEGLLTQAQARHGGELVRISAARAEAVGPYRGWRAGMPVTQWSLMT